MEVLGYVHRGGLDKPKSEIVEGLNEEFQALSVQDQADETPSLFAQGGPRSEQFIEYSINMPSIVKSYVRYQNFRRQGPRPVIIKRSQQGRAHMKKTQAMGIFKVAPNSVSIPGQEIPASLQEGARPMTTIKLHQDEILFVLGSVTVMIVVSDTSLNMALVWDGYSALPVGTDIENEDVLDFARL